MIKRRYIVVPGALLLLMLALVISACAASPTTSPVELTLAPKSALPDFAQNAPPEVQEAYRFAIANPDVLRLYPCYCGCSAVGHTNNLDCYVKEFRADGSIDFEIHAFG